jgi:hypothetical protein
VVTVSRCNHDGGAPGPNGGWSVGDKGRESPPRPEEPGNLAGSAANVFAMEDGALPN